MRNAGFEPETFGTDLFGAGYIDSCFGRCMFPFPIAMVQNSMKDSTYGKKHKEKSHIVLINYSIVWKDHISFSKHLNKFFDIESFERS